MRARANRATAKRLTPHQVATAKASASSRAGLAVGQPEGRVVYPDLDTVADLGCQRRGNVAGVFGPGGKPSGRNRRLSGFQGCGEGDSRR